MLLISFIGVFYLLADHQRFKAGFTLTLGAVISQTSNENKYPIMIAPTSLLTRSSYLETAKRNLSDLTLLLTVNAVCSLLHSMLTCGYFVLASARGADGALFYYFAE